MPNRPTCDGRRPVLLPAVVALIAWGLWTQDTAADTGLDTDWGNCAIHGLTSTRAQCATHAQP